MTNRIKLFTESVSQMGIGMPEAATLTKLFKVCLESALRLDDEEDTFFADDDTEYNRNDYGEEEEEIEPPTDYFGTDDVSDVNDIIDDAQRKDILRNEDTSLDMPNTQPDDDIRPKSNVGSTLVNAYTKYAPKLFDMHICTFYDISNFSNFIDWIINKFQRFNPDTIFQNYTSADNNKAYATKMDKILDVISSGPKVVNLLKDIKAQFGEKLSKASIADEDTLSPLVTGINDFISSIFADGKGGSEATDDNLFNAYSRGYASQSSMEEDDERTAAEADRFAKNYRRNTAKKKPDTEHFNLDADIDDVNDEVEEFINVIPTFGLTDAQEANLKKPSTRKNKAIIQQIAAKLDSLNTGTTGGTVNGDKLRQKAAKTFDEDI